MAKKRVRTNAMTSREVRRFQDDFIARIMPQSHFHVAMNHLANTCVAVKDTAGRFVWVSDNLTHRLGFTDPAELVGLDDFAISPPRLATAYRRDDEIVMSSGQPLLGRIELVFNDTGMLDWYVTNKLPLRDGHGRCIGLILTIQEYPGAQHLPALDGELRPVIDHIFAHLGEALQMSQLASLAGVSSRQLERRFRNVAGLSPKDFIMRARIEEACRRLREGNTSIGQIALDLGFYDQSAFTRLFRRHLGTTPSEFRRTCCRTAVRLT